MVGEAVVQTVFDAFNINIPVKQSSSKRDPKIVFSIKLAAFHKKINIRVNTRPQLVSKQSPHWLVIRRDDALDRVVSDALDGRGWRVGTAITGHCALSSEPKRRELVFIEYPVGVSWRALLMRRVKLLSADVVFVSRRKLDFSFLEAFEGSAVCED